MKNQTLASILYPCTAVTLVKPKRGRPPSKKKTEADEAARDDAEAAKQDAGSEDAYNEQDDEVGVTLACSLLGSLLLLSWVYGCTAAAVRSLGCSATAPIVQPSHQSVTAKGKLWVQGWCKQGIQVSLDAGGRHRRYTAILCLGSAVF